MSDEVRGTCTEEDSSMSDDAMDLPIQLLPSTPPRSVALAAEYLASTAAREMGLNNGPTALYWHLMHVVYQHAAPSPAAPEADR